MRTSSNIRGQEVVIHPRMANIFAFGLFAIIIILFGTLFSALHGWRYFFDAWREYLSDFPLLIGSVLAGMLLHEVLHAVVWASYAQNGLKSITFGIHWKQLAPFVHCNVAMPLKPYLAGVLCPGIVLGLLPLCIAIITGFGILFCFSAFFTAGAAGDIMCAWKLRAFKPASLVRDHPDHLGFIIERS